MEGYIGYLNTEYAHSKMAEGYNGVDRWHSDQSKEFKNNIYDKLDKAFKLTTDLDYPDGILSYRDKLQDIFDDIIETANNTLSSTRAKRFTDDLLTTLHDILDPRKAV